jgi:hypothetical protein
MEHEVLTPMPVASSETLEEELARAIESYRAAVSANDIHALGVWSVYIGHVRRDIENTKAKED